jgi:heptosyltransferase-1
MRILLIRTSALGDIVHCLPALRSLRQAFADARIGWVVEDVFAPLLHRDQDLDEVLEVGLRRWRRTPLRAATLREMRASLGRLAEWGPDVVLDLMGNHKAGALAAVTGTDRRIGLEARQRREPSSAAWLSEWVSARGGHAVDRALAVTAALTGSDRFPGFGPEKIREAAGKSLPSPAGYIVIHPGAAWSSKRYPAERWGRVAAALGRATARKVLVSIGPGEESLADAVERASGGAAARAEASDLPRLVGLLAGAGLVLGGDTGPLHLAHALGVPTLFLHGPTDPGTHGPYGAPERALRSAAAAAAHEKPLGHLPGRRGPFESAGGIDLPEGLVVERALHLVDNAPLRCEAGPV